MSPQPYHAFTQKYPGITNRIITPVHVAAAYDPANPPPNPKFISVSALWDTGASQSVVTATTAKTLGLVETGKSLVHHAGGKGMASTYVVNFLLPNQVGIQGVLVSECTDPEHNQFGAIIGMDIIMTGDLTITNHNGSSWVTFRFPSVGSVDYVAESQKLPQQAISDKVSRNAKCPCGSGKKYKYCHGKNP
jgi:hypothetical protein